MMTEKNLNKQQFEKEGVEPISDKYKVEPLKDERYKKQPVQKATASKKAFVNDQIMDVPDVPEYPRSSQSENYRVDVISGMTGLPMVHIKQVGWVGPAPLQVLEIRLDELIELLSKIRK
jgi:hypothetical protein